MKCNHENKQHTWKGEIEPLFCISEDGHDGFHKGFGKAVGMAILNPNDYPNEEIIEVEGINHLVAYELLMWDDASGEELQ